MKGDPLFPVTLKDSSFQAASHPTHYIVAENGLFLVRETPLFSASVPADGVPGMQPHGESLVIHFPRLPDDLLAQAMGFFRYAHEQWRGEAIVIIFYALPTGEEPGRFLLRAPPQTMRGRKVYGRFQADLRLDYEACEKPGPEYVKLGTFHSHSDLSAAHSYIDAHDELYESGLHVTAGYVNSSMPDFEASFVVGRTRFALPVGRVLPPFRGTRRPPREWLAQITVLCESWSGKTTRWSGASEEGGDGHGRPAC